MGIETININDVRRQSGDEKTKALNGIGFSDYMAAATGPAAETMALTQGYTPAAATSATMTGIIGTSSSFGGSAANTPYYSPLSTASTSFSSGGYSYGGATYSPGYVGVSTTVPTSTDYSSTYGSTTYDTTSTSQTAEQEALFQEMNDANWQMLVAQVTVNDLSRDYQARSNILKSKSDAEVNSVRNMKA
jgi:hypothetical protein